MIRILFIVQGEGRGHLTQAIALSEIIDNGYFELAACLVGSIDGESIPSLLEEYINCPIIPFRSPNLLYERDTGHLKLGATVRNGIFHFGRYFSNVNYIHQVAKNFKADVVINFYDVLGGLYNLFINQSKLPFIAVAHQYFLMHPAFRHPKANRVSRLLFFFNNWMTSAKCSERWALSFLSEEDQSKKRLKIMPPLLRSSIRNEQPLKGEDFILAYCTQASMLDRMIAIQRDLNLPMHCFISRKEDHDKLVSDHIHFHDIDPIQYITFMRSCHYLISTAGFESVCEAHYFEKSIILLPIPNHYEQRCNAIDAERVSVASRQISTLAKSDNHIFRNWVNQSTDLYVEALSSIVRSHQQMTKKRILDLLLWSLAWPLRRVLQVIY